MSKLKKLICCYKFHSLQTPAPPAPQGDACMVTCQGSCCQVGGYSAGGRREAGREILEAQLPDIIQTVFPKRVSPPRPPMEITFL